MSFPLTPQLHAIMSAAALPDASERLGPMLVSVAVHEAARAALESLASVERLETLIRAESDLQAQDALRRRLVIAKAQLAESRALLKHAEADHRNAIVHIAARELRALGKALQPLLQILAAMTAGSRVSSLVLLDAINIVDPIAEQPVLDGARWSDWNQSQGNGTLTIPTTVDLTAGWVDRSDLAALRDAIATPGAALRKVDAHRTMPATRLASGARVTASPLAATVGTPSQLQATAACGGVAP